MNAVGSKYVRHYAQTSVKQPHLMFIGHILADFIFCDRVLSILQILYLIV